ncbi:hypothetical protein MferCBS31731_000475 [Microsporum ferrugineum]
MVNQEQKSLISDGSPSCPRPGPTDEAEDDDDATASWATMPKKLQLGLTVCGWFCENAAIGSRQTFILFQLKSFKLPDGSVPSAATVAFHASILSASIAIPQFFMSTLWGILADNPRVGRKRVLLIGLAMTGVAWLGLAFANSFLAVVACYVLVGLTNNNMAVMRTIIRDISGKKFESRAILLMPTAFNLGSFIGPLLGGILSDPVGTYPNAFAPGSSLRQWLERWPYAVPNILNGMSMIVCAVLTAFLLEETHQGEGHRSLSIVPGWAKTLGRRLSRSGYEKVAVEDAEHIEMNDRGRNASAKTNTTGSPVSIWTRRLIITLFSNGLIIMHVGIFPSLLAIFLSTPRYDPEGGSASSTTGDTSESTATNGALSVPLNYHPHAPFTFTGGLSFKPSNIATALAIRGLVGLVLQLLFFPYLKRVFGLFNLYLCSLLVFPVTYFVIPFWATVPSNTLPPLPASGVVLWIFIAATLAIQTTARSFVTPSSRMLLNAASPDRSSLGTVNGISQSVAAVAKTAGPLLTGWLYGVGLRHGVVGIAWWAMSAIAVTNAVAGACLAIEKNAGKKRKPHIQATP